MKNIAKKLVVTVLGWQVRRLLRKKPITVVAVAGSIGKTSTKTAIATVLQQKFKVQYQTGNYNDLVSVPLIFFGEAIPSLLNPLAWAGLFLRNEKQLKQDYPYDVVVVEVGVDGPGQIEQYSAYLHASIAVLTAISPEHMEYFDDLDAVATEELSIANIADTLLVNSDLCDEKYINMLSNAPLTYGLLNSATYQLGNIVAEQGSYSFDLNVQGKKVATAKHTSISEIHLYSLCAAAAVAHLLGLNADQILSGFSAIQPVSGRMQQLIGINSSIILDDTYNASPTAVISALDTLYALKAPHKIAILGNMNELGKYSAVSHTEIGKYCDPEQLALVITLGPDSNQYLAAAAEERGCTVIRCTSPYEAGDYLKQHLPKGTVVLAKGSQNGVFAEEAIKMILADAADAARLVRQSTTWQKIKQKQFGQNT